MPSAPVPPPPPAVAPEPASGPETDLAPLVGASLEVMGADTKRMRGDRPFVFTNLKAGDGAEHVVRFIERTGGLAAS